MTDLITMSNDALFELAKKGAKGIPAYAELRDRITRGDDDGAQFWAERFEEEEGVIALVFDDNGVMIDYTYNWESAQSYALSLGRRVKVINGDGGMSKHELQSLCDTERARYIDCFGDCFGIED